MAQNTIADLSGTFSNNLDFLGQSMQGAANANTIDTIFQKFAALLARFYSDLGGTGTVGGTANAITFTSASTYTTLTTGLVVAFKATASISGAATFKLDGLAVKDLKIANDTDVATGDIVDKGVYLVRYDTALDGGNGAWVLLNPSINSLVVADFAAAAVVTEAEGLDSSDNDTSLPTTAAVKDYVDDRLITLGTDAATTSGASVTFSGIPATAKQITVSWRRGSTNGTGAIGIQIGDSGGLETSGYAGNLMAPSPGGLDPSPWSASALVVNSGVASGSLYDMSATLTLVNASTNTWQIAITAVNDQGSNLQRAYISNGSKSLSGVLDRVALITANTFDAGNANIAYH